MCVVYYIVWEWQTMCSLHAPNADIVLSPKLLLGTIYYIHIGWLLVQLPFPFPMVLDSAYRLCTRIDPSLPFTQHALLPAQPTYLLAPIFPFIQSVKLYRHPCSYFLHFSCLICVFKNSLAKREITWEKFLTQ